MIKQIAHICIHTEDLQATERFYTEGFGMERGYEFIKDGRLIGYYLKFGNMTFLEVFEGTTSGPGNINHVALETDEIDAVIVRLRQAGIPVGAKKMGADNSWQVWVTDPNGVRIEIQQYTAQSRQITGGQCIVNW
ncbi:VOC family protein [Coraliomargarita parva]|uniref:VOC family protein n=1 Tax=Coraliomargarita parva TaxID=3014050 RepID=UPI0022B51E80|nr:VOC family protein [Coraliomargarita parva]